MKSGSSFKVWRCPSAAISLVDFTHISREGRLKHYEAGRTYALPMRRSPAWAVMSGQTYRCQQWQHDPADLRCGRKLPRATIRDGSVGRPDGRIERSLAASEGFKIPTN